MIRTKNSTILFLFVFAAAVLSGCVQRPRSAYKDLYQDRLASVRVPTYEEIVSLKDEKDSDSFDQPSQRVWEACLDLAIQSKGILGEADDPGGGRRLLFISGKHLEYKRDMWLFVDRWLAISVRPITESSTEVLVAFVSPKTTRVAPFSADSFPKGFKGDTTNSISRAVGGEFIQALRKNLHADNYLSRLGDSPRPNARGVPHQANIRSSHGSESLEQQRADFQSATIRREQFVLNTPRLEEKITSVVHDIARAANQPDRDTRVFIIIDTLDATHVEPNGDIFITTGTLDEIKNIDELAGILAHELAHLYLHHEPNRVRAFKIAGRSRNTATFLATLGGAVIGGLLPTSKPSSASPQDTLLSLQDVFIGAAVGLGAVYLGGQIGTSLGVGAGGFIIHRFSRKDELEADEYGAELLWAAGYDYRGLLRLIQRSGRLLEETKK